MCNVLDNGCLRWNNISGTDEPVWNNKKQAPVTVLTFTTITKTTRRFWKCSTWETRNPSQGGIEARCLLKEMGLIYLRGPVRNVYSTTHQQRKKTKPKKPDVIYFLSNDVFLLGIQKQTCADMTGLQGKPPEEFHKRFSSSGWKTPSSGRRPVLRPRRRPLPLAALGLFKSSEKVKEHLSSW